MRRTQGPRGSRGFAAVRGFTVGHCKQLLVRATVPVVAALRSRAQRHVQETQAAGAARQPNEVDGGQDEGQDAASQSIHQEQTKRQDHDPRSPAALLDQPPRLRRSIASPPSAMRPNLQDEVTGRRDTPGAGSPVHRTVEHGHSRSWSGGTSLADEHAAFVMREVARPARRLAARACARAQADLDGLQGCTPASGQSPGWSGTPMV